MSVRRTILFSRRPALAPMLFVSLLASACSLQSDAEDNSRGESTASTEQDLLNRASPPRGPSASTPTLGPVGSAVFTQYKSDGTALVLNGSTVFASMSNGRDLTAAPSTDADAWIAASVGSSDQSPPGFGATLAATLDRASSHSGELEGGAMESLISWIGKLGGGVETNIGDTQTDFTGYSAERARWVASSLASKSYGFPPKTSYFDQPYPEPADFGEIDERGARLYCAGREAQRHQAGGATSVGSISAASFSILGKKIDLLVVEPTTVVNGPTKIDAATSRDGQQAFEVPMLMGTRITPVRGLGLPALDEMRYPVVLSTADAEVETPADLTWVRNGYTFEQRARRSYRTTTHADAITSAHKNMEATKRIEFIHSPVVDLGLTIRLGANVGQIERSNSRVIDVPYLGEGPGWPSSARQGTDRVNPLGVVAYHDGVWRWDPGYHGEIGHRPASWTVIANNPADSDVNVGLDLLNNAMNARLHADDDHSISTSTSLSLSGEISGSAKYPVVGPFSIGVSGSAGLGGSVSQKHVIADAVQLQRLYGDYKLPSAGVSVRPRTVASFDFMGGQVALIFSVSLPIVGSISREFTLFKIDPKTIASYDTDTSKRWPETASLRMGTASTWGDATQGAVVGSHVPNGYDYGSFDSGNVDSCLADTSPNPPTPPACGGAPAEGAPIEANICVVKPISGNFDVCSHVGMYIDAEATNPEQRDCLQHYYEFLCEPVQNTQLAGSPLYGTTGHLSHLTAVSDPATMSRLAAIQNECVAAFVDLSGDAETRKTKAKEYLDRQFTFAMCDAAAVPAPGGFLTLDPSSTPVGEAPPIEPSAPCPLEAPSGTTATAYVLIRSLNAGIGRRRSRCPFGLCCSVLSHLGSTPRSVFFCSRP